MGNRNSLGKLVSVTFLGGAIGRGLQYLTYVLVARLLGAEALGIFSLGYVLMNIGSIFARLGIDNAMKKYIPRYWNNGDYDRLHGLILFGLCTPLILGSALAVGGYYGLKASPIASIPKPSLIFLFGIPVMSTLIIGVAGTRGLFEAKYAVYAKDFIQSGLAVLLVILGSILFDSVNGAILGYVFSVFVGTVAIYFYLLRMSNFSIASNLRIDVREIIVFSTPLMLSAMANYFVTWTDILMLGILGPPSSVIGEYQALFQTTALLGFILFAVDAIYPSVASSLFQKQDFTRLETIYSVTVKWVLSLTALGGIYLVLYSSVVLPIFGIQFHKSTLILTFLISGFLSSALAGPATNMLIVSGHERIEMGNTILAASINGLLNFILIQIHGIVGAAMATAFAMGLLNALRIVEVWYLYNIRTKVSDFTSIMPGFVTAILVMTIAKYLFSLTLIAGSLIGLISLIAFGTLNIYIGPSEKDLILLEEVRGYV